MKTIKVNSKWHDTNAKNLNELKEEFGIDDSYISIYKGFSVSDNVELFNRDSVVFIKKGLIPPKEMLFEMMSARNSPEISEALRGAKVGIAGLGGLGSAVGIALARVGVGYLKLVDFDVVDPSNLNRQQYFVKDIGRFKTHALKDIIELINPFVSVEISTTKLDKDNVGSVFSNTSIVAECFDDPKAKAMLINSLTDKIIVAASGMAGYGRSELITTKRVARNLYVCGDLISEAKIGNGLMAPRVGICAMHQANKILELLIEENKNG